MAKYRVTVEVKAGSAAEAKRMMQSENPIDAIPAETIRQFLEAAHSRLKRAGYQRLHGATKAPTARTSGKAFIYQRPGYKEIWVSSSLRWWMYGAPEKGVFGNRPSRIEFESGSISDLDRLLEKARVNPPAVTDRALRYRANATPPPGEKRCALCGNANGLIEVGHVDGHEENSNPENLFWTCRSCNVLAGNAMRRAGVGRLTRQYNPTGGAKSAGAWMNAVQSMKGQGEMSVHDAVALIKATSHSARSRFSKQLWEQRRKIYGRSGRSTVGEVPF